MTDLYAIPDFQMPDGFLWGSATAGHQIEGNNVHSHNYQVEMSRREKDPAAPVSGMACNHYNMVREDVALLEKLGHQAYRMSVEWARLEPEEGVFDPEALAHYIGELELLKKSGLKVFLTLVHFTVPQWFWEKGGFSSLDNLCYFERYLNYIVPKITPYVDFWNVLNEFNTGRSEKKMKMKFNCLYYHALGYHLIKRFSSAPVSSAHALTQFYGKRQFDPFDTTLQQYRDLCDNEFFFHAIRTGELVLPTLPGAYSKDVKDSCDFWSVNLYTRTMVDARHPDFDGERFPFAKTKMICEEFYLDEIYPECMYQSLIRLRDKSVYITENGCSCEDDDFRIVYITEHLAALHQAIRDGIDVKGYLYWSLMDNWEWGSFVPTFGLVSVDREGDFSRTVKNSAWFYKEIIEKNGFSQELLRKYLSALPRVRHIAEEGSAKR